MPPHEVAIPEAWLDLLDASIKHRGPDGQGRFRDRAVRADGTVVDVALVHRRLSILDHAGGAQPMVGAGDSRLATRDSEGAGGRVARDDGGATFQGLALPVLFHGKPSDAVRYREVGGGKALARASCSEGGGVGRERHSLALCAPKEGSDLVAVVFNGCVYNHRELRKELQAAGHKFVSDHSDTEVLVHGWREWGEKLPDHLEGMFAFMLWDREGGRFVLARDPFGEKPVHALHVCKGGPWINVFSSVAICATPLSKMIGESSEPLPWSWTACHWLRFGYAPHAPLPQHSAVFPSWLMRYEQFEGAASNPRARCFGPLSFADQLALPRRDCTVTPEQIEPRLVEAVHRRLDADVPIGCFLSGGIDSSLIAAMMSKRTKARTFTVRMPDPAYDESGFAEDVARHLGTEHHTLECEASPASDLVHLITQIGLPFGDSSLLPTYWVSRAARRHVAVALSGDGGDELFLGYDRYRAIQWLTSPAVRLASRFLKLSHGPDPRSMRSRMSRLLSAGRAEGYLDLLSIFDSESLKQLAPGAQPSKCDRAYRAWGMVRSTDAADLDLVSYLPEDLLRKTDTASMAVALEVRCPMLDRDLVHYATLADEDSLLRGGQTKGLLRAVARRYLPAEIVDRPKMGFAIPIGEWFRTDYGGMKSLLMDTLNSADPFPASKLGLELDRAFIARMVDEHMNGKRDHSQRLYMLLVLGIWVRTL